MWIKATGFPQNTRLFTRIVRETGFYTINAPVIRKVLMELDDTIRRWF